MGGKIFEFGSYRLAVDFSVTDNDALCIAPRDIERDRDFFMILPQLFLNSGWVWELIDVKEASVLYIKMEFKSVDIDFLFASIEYREVGGVL